MPVRRHPVATTPNENLNRGLEAIPLDLRVVQRLRASYERVRSHNMKLAEVFYARLFDAAPQLRGMFKSSPQAQSEKLMAALDAVVRNLEKPEENAAMLLELGGRHAAYGARPEHYELVIELLVESMATVLENPDQQSLAEWRVALQLISRQMLNGGAAKP